MEGKTTKITFENEDGAYTIEVKKTEMNIDDIFGLLIIPALQAASYSETCINEHLQEYGADK